MLHTRCEICYSESIIKFNKSLIIYPRVIPSANALKVTTSLKDVTDSCPEINFLEHVQVRVNLNYTIRGDLEINLTSPQGTTSRLTQRRPKDNSPDATYLTNWTILTLHHWGENPSGIWELSLKNSRLEHKNTGYYIICCYMFMPCYAILCHVVLCWCCLQMKGLFEIIRASLLFSNIGIAQWAPWLPFRDEHIKLKFSYLYGWERKTLGKTLEKEQVMCEVSKFLGNTCP